MTLHKSLPFWAVFLLGLFYISIQCDARAVNVSNTWTMPQEGLNVFYRFFRDRISWFEADAVCQFHHANLVTVDNSFQFDATRDLLRELDVNDIVWIGLMRPQSSDRFMWSNSRPLVVDTGYWAESLPLMDAPLCAVIDPIRDYRWHALRCGGPETASFLCEMPVPSWADSCILKDMPNLTMQYMADTASIELIRNCEEEGLLRQTCKGKEDRDRAIRELICPRERLEAQRINDITNSHFKSLQIINSIRTDNNENNDIELLPLGQSYSSHGDFVDQVQTEKNTVQRLIEQFNVDELMQADEPSSNSGYRIPGEIPKPVKKAAKKVIVAGDYPKKDKVMQKYGTAEPQKPHKQQMLALEDMMMGDQPHGEPEMIDHEQDDDVSNEIMEPLPHKKKILPQDLKTMATITEGPMESKRFGEEDKKLLEEKEKKAREQLKTTEAASTTTTTTTTTTPTTTTTTTTAAPTTTTTTTTPAATTPLATSAITSEDSSLPQSSEAPSTAAANGEQTTVSQPTATIPPATIGHPMHPQQPRSNVITEETQHPHVKESADNSHFIPPMLLVKSHYVPPTKHDHGDHHEHHIVDETTLASNVETAAAAETIKSEHRPIESETVADITESTGRIIATDSIVTTMAATTVETHAQIIDDAVHNANRNVPQAKTTILRPIGQSNHTKVENLDYVSTTTTTTMATTTTAGHHVVTTTTIQTPSDVELIEQTTDEEVKETAKPTIAKATTTIEHVATTTTMKLSELETAAPATTGNTEPEIAVAPSAAVAATTTTATEKAEIQKIPTESSGRAQQEEAIVAITTDAPATITTLTPSTTTTTTTTTVAPPTTTTTLTVTTTQAPMTTTTEAVAITTEAPVPTRNFLKEETEAPFKPNRRRSLTKPETVSYFKKILG